MDGALAAFTDVLWRLMEGCNSCWHIAAMNGVLVAVNWVLIEFTLAEVNKLLAEVKVVLTEINGGTCSRHRCACSSE